MSTCASINKRRRVDSLESTITLLSIPRELHIAMLHFLTSLDVVSIQQTSKYFDILGKDPNAMYSIRTSLLELVAFKRFRTERYSRIKSLCVATPFAPYYSTNITRMLLSLADIPQFNRLEKFNSTRNGRLLTNDCMNVISLKWLRLNQDTLSTDICDRILTCVDLETLCLTNIYVKDDAQITLNNHDYRLPRLKYVILSINHCNTPHFIHSLLSIGPKKHFTLTIQPPINPDHGWGGFYGVTPYADLFAKRSPNALRAFENIEQLTYVWNVQNESIDPDLILKNTHSLIQSMNKKQWNLECLHLKVRNVHKLPIRAYDQMIKMNTSLQLVNSSTVMAILERCNSSKLSLLFNVCCGDWSEHVPNKRGWFSNREKSFDEINICFRMHEFWKNMYRGSGLYYYLYKHALESDKLKAKAEQMVQVVLEYYKMWCHPLVMLNQNKSNCKYLKFEFISNYDITTFEEHVFARMKRILKLNEEEFKKRYGVIVTAWNEGFYPVFKERLKSKFNDQYNVDVTVHFRSIVFMCSLSV
eukprot:616900_1